MTFTSGPPATSEVVRFERPNFWQLRGASKILSSGFEGRVTPTGDGAHLALWMEIRLHGPLAWRCRSCAGGCSASSSATSPP
jgi:hypothetical protein